MNALQPFAPGDIFVTASDLDESARFPTGHGKILQFAADWTAKGVFETAETGLIASLTLDQAGNLHALDPQARALTSIGPDGTARPMFAALPQRAYGSMIALGGGDYLIGEHMVGQIPGFSGDGRVYRVDAAGTVIAAYDTETNGGMGGFLGVTHMALSADGNMLFHTSETGPHIYAHDLAGNKRLGPVYTRSDPPPLVFGLSMLPDGQLLVACGSEFRRIDPDSGTATSMALPEGRGWAVPILRRCGTEVWALDFFGGKLARVAVADGAVLDVRDLGLAKCLTGLAEISA
jgi:hypothetical protein